MKDGEESKKKLYRALVELSKPVDDASLERINSMSEFEIKQKTPIRVLHRFASVPSLLPKSPVLSLFLLFLHFRHLNSSLILYDLLPYLS